MKIDLIKIEEISIVAGNLALEYRKKGFGIRYKADGSPVTEADLTADELIRQGLRYLYPDIAAITEETWDEEGDPKPETYWCVDPIDGTRGFISGSDEFTINIGLIDQHYPVLGVIYAPALAQIWTGGYGKAWMREASIPHPNMGLECMHPPQALKTRSTPSNHPDIVATKNSRNAKLKKWIEGLNAKSAISVGSSLKFCTIAEGKADLYPRISPTMEWDTAAGQAIVEAAGGCVLNPQGARFSYGKPQRMNGHFAAMGVTAENAPLNWLAPPNAPQND